MGNTMILGEVDLPEGILIILDPGLARFWRHNGDPKSPKKSDPRQYDLHIVEEHMIGSSIHYICMIAMIQRMQSSTLMPLQMNIIIELVLKY